MGGGAAFGEELIHEQGRTVNPAFISYAMARSADLPRIRTILVEGGDTKGPHGAKGIGELCNTPPAPAIANAVYDATGVRVGDLPITPDKILAGLARKEGRRRDHALWRRPSRWWIAFVRFLYPRGLLKFLHAYQLRRWLAAHRGPIERIDTPQTLDGALSSISAGGVPLAGGTDLLPSRQQGLSAAPHFASVLDVPELAGVTVQADGSIVLGAAASLAEVARATAKACPVLAETIRNIASSQIREMATVGGNLLQGKRCWFYRNGFHCYKRAGLMAPCYAVSGDHRFYHAAIGGHRCQAVTPSDLATTLIALDADAVVASSRGRRTIPVAGLYRGPGETVLQPDEILVDVRIPAVAAQRRSAFEKLGLWEGDFAVASAALTFRPDPDGRWHDVRLVFGALAPTPYRAMETEANLENTIPTLAVLRTLIDRELDRVAHPLANNGWKLDAAAGLAENAAGRLLAAQGDRETP